MKMWWLNSQARVKLYGVLCLMFGPFAVLAFDHVPLGRLAPYVLGVPMGMPPHKAGETR